MKTKNHSNITLRGKLIIRLLSSFVLLFAGAGAAHATQCVQSGNWSNPATWGGGVPAGSAELIDCTVFLDIPVTIANLTLGGTGNGGTLSNAGGNSITVTNRLELSRGDISGPSPLAVVIPSTATLVFSGPSAALKFIGGNTTIHNAGRIEWPGGAIYFNGTLNNSGTFVISGDAGFGHPLRTGVINNTGSIVKESGNGTTQFSGFTPETNSIATKINNTGDGVVAVASGTVEMGPGTSDGQFIVASGKTLKVGLPHTFKGAEFTGGGTCSLGGGSRFVGDIHITLELEVSSTSDGFYAGDGAAQNEATFHGSGRLVWRGNSRIHGKLTLAPDFQTVVLGDGLKYPVNVINQGTMIWAGGGPIGERGGAFLRNEGTFHVLAAGTFLGYASNFENIGTLNTFGGGKNTSDAANFTNSGVVNIGGFGRAGILDISLPSGFSQTATGTLFMEIGGANAATPEFDQLTGPSAVNGTLVVDVINNYTPPKDARFVLLNNRTGQFAHVFTPNGAERSRIEYPGSRCELVSLSDAPIPLRLWGAGRDLARNESPDRAAEQQAVNETAPQWSYGYRSTAAGTAFTPFTPQQHINEGTGLHGWIGPGQATLGVNTKNSPIVFNIGSGDYQPLLPQQLYLSPGSGNEFLVVRWTAPADGDYRFGAKWFDLDAHGGDGASAHLVINGVEEYKEEFEDGGKARFRVKTFSLHAGDVVDFVVGARANSTFDATALNAVVRRVPKVTITSPASGAEMVTGEDFTVTVEVEQGLPIKSVELRLDDAPVGTISAPPYEFVVDQLEPGIHGLNAIAIDVNGAKRRSPTVKITGISAATPGAAKRNHARGSEPFAAAAEGITYKWSVAEGFWHEPGNWTPNGVPGPNDWAMVGNSAAVTLTDDRTVRGLSIDTHGVVAAGIAPGSTTHPTLTILGNLNQFGLIKGPIDLVLSEGARFTNFDDTAVWEDVNFINRGNLTIEGNLASQRSTLTNHGTTAVRPPPGSENSANAFIGGLTAPAGEVRIADGALISTNGADFAGTLRVGGAGIIGLDGGTLIGLDGGTLIGLDGGTLIGNDGSTLIGNDGSTLIGNDGSTLIGLDGGTLIGNDGSTIQPTLADSGTASTASGILLTGGTITGSGVLRGNVVNQAGFIMPGNSAGGIVVIGDYTQQSGATLVLEMGGKTSNPFTYDIFQVSGTANLGGKLIMKTINGYTPASGDAVSPLLYGSRTGNFDSVSSNAQITFGAKGAQVNVTGPNPPAPKALNIATRMKVETGDNVLIAGFIITGSQSKKVIIRGIGPSLPFGGILADPTLSLDNGAVTNDNWRTDQEQEIIATTIPPSSELESAIVATLIPGPHTAILRGSGGATGIGVIEVYDLESGSPVQLANISSRGFVQSGDNVMIGGFIIGGTYPAKVIVRAIGPSLSFAGKLEDPTLELVDQNGGRISNDNWRAAQEAEIIGTTIPPTHENEAAIVSTLAPGQYTAIVRGADDTTGIAVVEAYNLQ